MRILFTGGGSGGHIYPILAIAEEFKKEQFNLRLYYLGAPGPYKKLLKESGIKVSGIVSGKLRRYFDLRNFLDIPKFFFGFIQALWKVFWIMPSIMFSKGGPGALAVVLACRFYRIPVIIHDSDSIPGLTNRISARFAKRIGVSFVSAAEYFPKPANIALMGNPIRPSLIKDIPEQGEAKEAIGFNPRLSLILIVGGSQGASSLNNFFISIAAEMVKNFQILHQTGRKTYKEIESELALNAKNLKEEEKGRYKLTPYLDENSTKNALAAADLVIGRAGSGTIFELAAFGKPAILIPLSEKIVGRHQINNAYEYAGAGAAMVIEEDNLKLNIFLPQLEKLFSEPEKLKSMSQAALKFAKPEAAKMIEDEIIRLGS